MTKYNFMNDYSEGAHQNILAALSQTNLTQETGYGDDQYCQQAAELIREKIGDPGVDIHFVSGGTQANLILISSILKPYESVIAVKTGHICVHETGAIEATGHKVNYAPGKNGKISPEEIRAIVAEHTDEHMVQPRLVYISQSTELGTIYSRIEMEQISAVCHELGLYLYVDGARLGSALTAKKADLALPQLSKFADAFYIGGTKNGALLGEAVVLRNPDLKPHFRFHIKQKGGLLSKGRILGIQFLELFRNDLYFNLAGHANQMAAQMAAGLAEAGYSFQYPAETNQLFPILPNWVIDQLNQEYRFYTWEKIDPEHSSVRLVTSWATPQEAIDKFLVDLKEASVH
jgi:threonine aldolase